MRTFGGLLVAVAVVAATAAAAPTSPPPPVPGTVAWSPGSVIAFGADVGTSSRGGIYTIHADGTGMHRLTTLGGGGSQLRWSPAGGTLLFDAGLKLYSIRADGTRLHAFGAGFTGVVWSPDGSRIAFERADGIYVMRANGSGVHRIAQSRYQDGGPPAWSPDGSRIAFVACSAPYLSQPCEHQYGFDVYVIGSDGTGKQKVTPRAGFPQCVAWSADGKLAFLTSENTVAIVQTGGTLRTFRPAGCPVWSPAGPRYATENTPGVGLLNADGTGRAHIPVRPDLNDGVLQVAWSPDGVSLAVIAVSRPGGSPRRRLYVVGANGSGLRRIA